MEYEHLLRARPSQKDSRSSIDPAKHTARLTRWILDLMTLINDEDIPGPESKSMQKPWPNDFLLFCLLRAMLLLVAHRLRPGLSPNQNHSKTAFEAREALLSRAAGSSSSSLGLSSSRHARLPSNSCCIEHAGDGPLPGVSLALAGL